VIANIVGLLRFPLLPFCFQKLEKNKARKQKAR